MSVDPKIVVLGDARTPAGSFGGALKESPRTSSAPGPPAGRWERTGIAPDRIDEAS